MTVIFLFKPMARSQPSKSTPQELKFLSAFVSTLLEV